eukprot:Tamp_12966.p1 GENE.Tamp_12966~~Tamp_12966.p1  ORF type:complete len:582 (-),score=75.64 Tamp_12966:16-1761(-)
MRGRSLGKTAAARSKSPSAVVRADAEEKGEKAEKGETKQRARASRRSRSKSPAEPEAAAHRPALGWRVAVSAAALLVLAGAVVTIPPISLDPPLALPTQPSSSPQVSAGVHNDRYEEEYRKAKEAFYAGNRGGSTEEVVRVTAVAPVGVACAHVLQMALQQRTFVTDVAVSFFAIAWPLFCCFVLPEAAGHVMVVLAAVSLLVAALSGVQIRGHQEALRDIEEALNLPRKAFVTAYRSTMMLATCIAILAVDFQSFPRRFSKTEAFGVSLMDAGVGAVLLSQATVSPLTRHSGAAASQRIASAVLSSSPLLVLGGVRIAGTIAADYHTHVTEYGVHWNFFFTLAVISIVGNALPLQGMQAGIGAVAIAGAYQYALTATDLQEYILSAPRTDLLSANREGVFGCIGYASVFFSGVALGKLVFGAHRSPGKWMWVCVSLLVAAAALWAILLVLAEHGYAVSRRLVNLPYILWTLAYNCLLLALFLLGELAVHWIEVPAVKRGGRVVSLRKMSAVSCQMLCDAINRNQLAVFLASNLMTGATNMVLPTLTATWREGFVTMTLYTLTITCVASELQRRNITLKFW